MTRHLEPSVVFGLACALMLSSAACTTDSTEQTGDEPSIDVEDWEPEFVDGELQPLPDGFPEDTITIVSVDEPGSRDGIYSRNLDQALEGISPVDIVVSDEPSAQGGTLGALVDTSRRPGGEEGLWPVVVSVMGSATDWNTAPIEDELGIAIDDVNFFMVTETHPWVIAQRADAPWGASFAEFVEYGRDNPGELRYMAGETGGGSDIAMSWMLNELGVEAEKVPADGRPAAIAAIGAGEGDFTMTQPQVALSAEGRVEVIYATTQEVPELWAGNDGVASAQDLQEYGLDGIEWGTLQGFALPAEVPEAHVAWLHALFSAAVEQDVYQERVDSNPGMQIAVLSTEETNRRAVEALEISEPIVREAGLHWEDQ